MKSVAGLLLAMTMPFILMFGIAFVGGASTEVSSLGFTGSTFRCEWVSEDGTNAVLVSNLGFRRLVAFDRPTAIKSGKEYRLKSSPATHRFGGWKAYLTPV